MWYASPCALREPPPGMAAAGPIVATRLTFPVNIAVNVRFVRYSPGGSSPESISRRISPACRELRFT
jgi:hypothetical protein